MARRTIAVIIASSICASSALAKMPEPISLARSEKWIADLNNESCKLVGEFGNGDDRVTMLLTRYEPGDSFSLNLYGRPFRSQQASTRIRLAFGPNAELVQRDVPNATAGTRPLVMVGGWRLDNRESSRADEILPTITPAQEAAVRTLDFRVSGKAYRLELGSMVATMRILRQCMDGLITSWGFDPAEQAALMRPPAPASTPATWLVSDDYPSDALQRGERGIVYFRLNIDETGKPVTCHVLSTTKPKGFDDLTCRLLMRRAAFLPAISMQAKAIKSFYISFARWTIPD